MFNFGNMTPEDCPFSDLESLPLKDNITEDDILQLPELFPEEQGNPPNETALTHEFENLSITPTDKPTTPFNDRPRKQKPTIRSRQLFKKQRKSEEATSYYSFTKNPQFHFNLTYKLKENNNQWRTVFWDPKRQEFTLENPSLNFQRISVPLRSISAFYQLCPIFTKKN